MRLALAAALGIALAVDASAVQVKPPRPETSVSVVNGKLAWGKLVLGMSVTEVENVLAESLVLKPTDPKSACHGREAVVEAQKQRVTVTFAMSQAGGRLIGIHVPFLAPRDLKEVANGLKAQVPDLRYRSSSPKVSEAVDPTPLYVLPQNDQQAVLINAGAGLSIGVGCWPPNVIWVNTNEMPPVQVPPSQASLRARVEAMTGPNPVDCGQHVTRAGKSGSVVTADAGTLMRSINCGTIAMKQGKSFWVFQQLRGIDSWVAEGLLSKDGVVYRFFYDDDKSGGSGAPPNFVTERCPKPDVAMERGEARFGCPERLLLPQTGAIVGRVSDVSGGALPGVTVTVTGPGGAQKAFTKADGTYRITDLEPGTYRLEATLSGFRPAKADSILVVADQSATHDIGLRLGISTIVDYIGPEVVTEAVRKADVIVHIRVAKAVGTRLVNDDSTIATDHEATVVSVVRADRPTIAPGGLLVFSQDNAGTWREDGKTYVGREPLYSPDDVLVAFLKRSKDGTLIRYWGPFYMWPVKQGIVLPGDLRILKESGVGTQMPVDEAVAALRKLAGGQQPKPQPAVIQGLDEIPADGVVGALRAASVVAHIEITNSLGPRLVHGDSIVGTRFVGKAISVVKTDRPGIADGSTVTFDQRFAGRVMGDGRPVIGLEPPFEMGGYVAFLRRYSDGTLEDFAGEALMLPVAKGFVLLGAGPFPKDSGLKAQMPLAECLAALRKLLAGGLR